MIDRRNTGVHAPDCPCKRCAMTRDYDTPMMGESICPIIVTSRPAYDVRARRVPRDQRTYNAPTTV